MKSFSIWVRHGRLQYVFSYLVGIVANCRWRWFKNWAIRRFIRKYHVDISIAQQTSLEAYPSFNDFFIRRLKPEARPIVSGMNQVASPVDGAISQMGKVNNDLLFQAKGFHFSLKNLLGNDEMASLFHNGLFATVYLAPRDYHRVHMPVTGKLKSTIFIPGKLFSVNTHTTENVENLFALNERLVCLFDTEFGPMAMIMVGAMLVGSIHTTWQSPFISKTVALHQHSGDLTLERGEELGYFKMGSTVIMLFGENALQWDKHLKAGSVLQMGQLIAERS